MDKKKEIKLPEGVDNDFMDILKEVIKEHDVAFKGLAEGLSVEFLDTL